MIYNSLYLSTLVVFLTCVSICTALLPAVLTHYESFVKEYNGNRRSEYKKYQQLAQKQLHTGSRNKTGQPLDDIIPSFPLNKSMLFYAHEKTVVGPDYFQAQKSKFIVYAAGIGEGADFEELIAGKYAVSVHAFDCTVPANTTLKNGVHFHHWCLGGKDQNFEGNSWSTNAKNKTFVFKTLANTMKELGHEHIDLLKMDIEGFEWDLIDTEIFKSKNMVDLPDQIAIELHSQGASQKYVPVHLSKDKTRKFVNDFVLKLWRLGYRVVHKERNMGDPSCAEVTFLRIHV